MNIIQQRITTADGHIKFRQYAKKQHLGQGGFANCYQVKRLDDGKQFAIKIVNKALLTKPQARSKMLSQMKLHRSARHKNICQVHHIFQDELKIYILLQLCRNQTLFCLLNKRKRLTTPQVQFYVYQITQAICYLHQHKIVHRDLKLGNILLDDNLNVKLSDFGLATKIQFLGDRKHSVCGTPNYIAPQIIKFGLQVQKSHSGHSYQVDIWSIGVIIYILLIGNPPFQSDSRGKTYKKVCHADYSFPKFFKDEIAKDLIRKILVVDPSKRLTLQEILKHPFMNPDRGIPKHLPLISLKSDPKLIEFEKMEEDQSLKQSARNISLSSIKSLTQSSFQKYFQDQNFLSKKNSQLSDNSNDQKTKTLKAVCSYGSLPKSIEKLSHLKRCMSSKAIPVLETQKKIESDQVIGSPRAHQYKKLSEKSYFYRSIQGKTTMPTNISIQNQQVLEEHKNKKVKQTYSPQIPIVLSLKKDIIWSYIMSNGFIGTYQSNSNTYKLLYDKRLNTFIQINNGQLKNAVFAKNVEMHEDILNRKKFIDQHVDKIRHLEKYLEDENLQPIYIDKMFEIKNEALILLILSNKTIQLLNYQKNISLVKYGQRFNFIQSQNQRIIKRTLLTQNQVTFSQNKQIQFLYSRMKKALNKIGNKI